jgi:hypothetical protein
MLYKQAIRAYRTLNHAILYLGENIEEKIAVDYLELARREVLREKRAVSPYALYGHWCEKCPRYRNAPRPR